MKRMFVCFLGFLLSSLFLSGDVHSYEIRVDSIEWVDGDSGWINGRENGFEFRLANIDVPPLYGTCLRAARISKEAKRFVSSLSKIGGQWRVTKYYYKDRYGRHVVDLAVSDLDVGDLLLNKNLAKEWRFFRGKPLHRRPKFC